MLVLVHDLLSDVRTQYASVQHTADALDDIATRFHYRLVVIHPWPHGNGRHARLATDVLLEIWKQGSRGETEICWCEATAIAAAN